MNMEQVRLGDSGLKVSSGQIDRITPAGVLTAYDVVPPDHDLPRSSKV